MPKKVQNKRSSRSRRARRRRRTEAALVITAAVALLVICAVSFFFVSRMRRSMPDTASTVVAAATEAPLAGALATALETAPATAIAEATAAPEPTATPEPAATPEPTETPEPTATPYAGPTPVPTREPVTLTLTATGDVTLANYEATGNFKKYYNKYGYTYFLENVRDLFMQDDITIVNLEGPLTDSNNKRGGRRWNFKGMPEYNQILSYASVELCNLANNHILDYQQEGEEDTWANLEAVGIGYSGYGPEYYTDFHGYTIGSVGFTEWNFKEDEILAAVAEAANKCDLLIVSMHWNEEGKKYLSNYCIKMGKALIDAGAHIVIGNHTHFPGEIMRYNGRYIINSLGNLCFGGNDVLKHFENVIFRERFLLTDDGAPQDQGIDLIPAMSCSSGKRGVNDFKPYLATGEEGLRILEEVAGYCKHMDGLEIRWMPDSYIVKNGLLEQFGGSVADDAGVQAAATEEKIEETTEGTAKDTIEEANAFGDFGEAFARSEADDGEPVDVPISDVTEINGVRSVG